MEKKNCKKNSKGFTIMGVIVAIFISSVSMAAILGLVSSSFNGASVGKMRLIASGLAQEGIEIIRDYRRASADENNWDTWYGSVSSGDYLVEITVGNDVATYGYSEIPLKWDPVTGLYQYQCAEPECEPTPFYRKITLTNYYPVEEYVNVVSEVRWQFKGQDYVLTARDNLWNWK